MLQNRLRIYSGPPVDTACDTSRRTDQVTLPLGEILPLLMEASKSDRTWLHDFDDDEITISTDLYEVALAYQHFRRPSA